MMFTSPDTLVPDPYNPLDWNRYAYTRYNPIRFIDPSGHSPCDVKGADPECNGLNIVRRPKPVQPSKNTRQTKTPQIPQVVPTPDLPFNPSGIYFGPYGPTPTPQTVLRSGPTTTPTPTGTPTLLPPDEIAKQMGEELVRDTFSLFRYDPGSATGTDVSSMILSGAQSISMSSPQLRWVYPVAQTVVGIATVVGAIWDAAPAVEKWWSDANANMSATATMLPMNGPTVSPTSSPPPTYTPVPIPSPTYTPTFPPPIW